MHLSILLCSCLLILFFVFKQTTSYDLLISVWSSDVCSSDLQWLAAATTHVRRSSAAIIRSATGFVVAEGPPDERGRMQDTTFRRSEEHTSELQSLMRTSYAVFCLKKNKSTHS